MNHYALHLNRQEALALNEARFSFPGYLKPQAIDALRDSLVDALTGELDDPIRSFYRFPLNSLVDYLIRSHALYTDKLLMELDHTWIQLIKSHKESGLLVLYSMYREFMTELIVHFKEEEERFFPYALAVYGIAERTSLAYPVLGKSSGNEFLAAHDDPADSLMEVTEGLESLFCAQSITCPLSALLLRRMKVLCVDLIIHGLIEEDVLVLKVIQYERRFQN